MYTGLYINYSLIKLETGGREGGRKVDSMLYEFYSNKKLRYIDDR